MIGGPDFRDIPDTDNDEVRGSSGARDSPNNAIKLILELGGAVCSKNRGNYNSLILLVVHFCLDRGNIGCPLNVHNAP
jgi:hypothetical protein